MTSSSRTRPTEGYDAIVVGAGFAGMYALLRLRRLGATVRVFETADGVGGTWHWNRYPGARVDVHSLNYSYSFSPELQQEWSWPEVYSSQPELLKYANHVADRFNLRSDIQLETSVTSADFDEEQGHWLVRTDRGECVTARYLITAVGCLSAVNSPNITGLESFQGESLHTARWPKEGVELSGKRVGVVGTGSSGIQVIPILAEEASHLFVFQRTPNYSLPTYNRPMDPQYEREWKERYDEHREMDRDSYAAQYFDRPEHSALEVTSEEQDLAFEQAWHKGAFALMACFNDLRTNREANDLAAEFVRRQIRAIVKDSSIAESLCPKDYPIGTKRLCLDTSYFETFNRDNVTLVDIRKEPIIELTPAGVRTSEGVYDLDAIVFATGFDAMTGALLKMNITGRNGLSLRDKWKEGPRTYLGVSVAGFPNLFMITGPGSPSVLVSMIAAIEQHVDFIVDVLTHVKQCGSKLIEAEVGAENTWSAHVNELAERTLFKHANSWYLGANIAGKPRVFMPYVGGFDVYRKQCDQVAHNDYEGFKLA
jgi:cation diffusion facilitator CzcD-associated flavoprotein CzcO